MPESPPSRNRRARDLPLPDLRKAQPLGREAEALLLRRALAGDRAARDVLVLSNLRFVIGLALRLRHGGLPVGDLVAEGCLGLFRALDGFEPDRGVRFLTYGVWWAKAGMLRAIGRAQEAPGAAGPRWEVPEEDAADGDWRERMPMRLGTGRMDGPEAGRALLGLLPPREAQVLRWLYGLGRGPTLTLREAAIHLGISHQRVRQLRDQALGRLRDLPAFRPHHSVRAISGDGHSGISPRNPTFSDSGAKSP